MKDNGEKAGHSPIRDFLKRAWHFLWHDESLLSYVVLLFLSILLVVYIIYPLLGLFMNTSLPVVAIVSGSMEHGVSADGNICGNTPQRDYSGRMNLDDWWNYCGNYYEEEFLISKDDFLGFPYSGGMYIGDVVFLRGVDGEDIEVGDVLIFEPGNRNWYEAHGPVIHRVVEINEEGGEYYFTTKGDANEGVEIGDFERDIPEDRVFGVATTRIPYIGYPRVLLNELIMVFR